MEKLKVCPFCGGEPATAIRQLLNKVDFVIFCKECYINKTISIKPEGNEITFNEVQDGIEEAIKKWNIRF